MPLRSRSSALLACLIGAGIGPGPDAAAGDTRTGVCPDGSIFVVRRAADNPCRDAREVEPQEVPPIKPQLLPRPYAWEVFRKQQDPNNPYNLVEAARRVREAGQAGEAPGTAPPPEPTGAAPEPPGEAPGPPETPQTALLHSARPPPSPLADFSQQEVRDLMLIVELTQRRAPATFEPEEGRALVLRLAHSAAFDSRLRDVHGRRGVALSGPVLLFSAVARDATRFHGHLTFVQGHRAFHPDAGDPGQFGVLHGALGALDAEQAVLGYVVLPAELDPARPMDIYWNDRRLTATLVGNGAP